MKKILLLLIPAICFAAVANAQLKVGPAPTSIDASAMFQVDAGTSGTRVGVLMPRVSLSATNIAAPAASHVAGLVVYNTVTVADVTPGFYYNDGTKWVRINSSSASGVANNGLSVLSSTTQLGGGLIKPTTITADAVNTLAIQGLQSGDVSKDSVVVADAATGVLKRISIASIAGNIAKLVYTATAGQTSFTTPYTITDLNKIQVFRNGNEIDFTATIGSNTLSLAPDTVFDSGCYAGDEIKIIQHY